MPRPEASAKQTVGDNFSGMAILIRSRSYLVPGMVSHSIALLRSSACEHGKLRQGRGSAGVLRQAAARLQVGEETVDFRVAIEARQPFPDVVGEQFDFGGGHRLGVMHTVL